ncbi:hypothetical protein AAG906_017866 [Vitis piasezkii]
MAVFQLNKEKAPGLDGFTIPVYQECRDVIKKDLMRVFLEVSKWPLSCLGLPLGGNPKTIGFWDPVVERISRRLDGWKKAFLSLGGRITLIQSCLSHIPSYFLSLFKIPASITSKIEKMQWSFEDMLVIAFKGLGNSLRGKTLCESASMGDGVVQGPSQAWRTRGMARIVRGIVLMEKEACTGRESGLVEKESLDLSKGFLGIGPNPFGGRPSDGKARFGEGPHCSKDYGLLSLLSEDQARLDGPKVRRQSCFASKAMKVVRDDKSKEAPPNISLYVSRSHHSPSRKLSRSRARSLPLSFEERYKAFLKRRQQGYQIFKGRLRSSEDGLDGTKVKDGSQPHGCLIQSQRCGVPSSISSSKMASIKSIMGTLNVNIVKYSKNGVQSAKNNGCLVEKMKQRGNLVIGGLWVECGRSETNNG